MIHYGDITKISGYEVPIVDCVVGGSPCQDLSVAGKRKGMKKGDKTRSGLLWEVERLSWSKMVGQFEQKIDYLQLILSIL